MSVTLLAVPAVAPKAPILAPARAAMPAPRRTPIRAPMPPMRLPIRRRRPTRPAAPPPATYVAEDPSDATDSLRSHPARTHGRNAEPGKKAGDAKASDAQSGAAQRRTWPKTAKDADDARSADRRLDQGRCGGAGPLSHAGCGHAAPCVTRPRSDARRAVIATSSAAGQLLAASTGRPAHAGRRCAGRGLRTAMRSGGKRTGPGDAATRAPKTAERTFGALSGQQSSTAGRALLPLVLAVRPTPSPRRQDAASALAGTGDADARIRNPGAQRKHSQRRRYRWSIRPAITGLEGAGDRSQRWIGPARMARRRAGAAGSHWPPARLAGKPAATAHGPCHHGAAGRPQCSAHRAALWAASEWAPALGGGVKLLVDNKGSSTAEILQAHPARHGSHRHPHRLQHVRAGGGDFGAELTDTKNALDAALPRLREMLADSGISLGGSGVEHRQQNAGNPRLPRAAIPWRGRGGDRSDGQAAVRSA